MRAPPGIALWTTLVLALAAPAVRAQGDRASSFAVNRWNTESGLPQNSVNAVFQSRDGYLWLTTFGGIARFDGTSFFNVTTGDHPGLRSDRGRALAQAPDGSIWIATEDGLSRFDHGRVTTLTTAGGMPGAIVNGVAAAADGSIWFTTGNGALGRVSGGRVQVIVRPATTLGSAIEDLIAQPGGGVWVSARTGIWRVDPRATSRIERVAALDTTRRRLPRLALDPDSTHDVWASTDSGLVDFSAAGARYYRLAAPGLDPAAIHAMAVASGRVVWLSTGRNDLWRYRADSNSVTPIDSLGAQAIVALAVDREGSVWIGDRVAGLARVRPTLFHSYAKAEGLPADNVAGVFADSLDRLWIAARCGGAGMRDGAGFHVLAPSETPRCVTTFAEDTSGAIWMGGDGLVLWRDGVVLRPDTSTGLPAGTITALYRDRRGTVWVGAHGGLARWDAAARVFRDVSDGGRGYFRNVRTIHEARDGTMWIGTERGLVRYAGGVARRFTRADGLPSDFIRDVYEDNNSNLWIATYGGGLARLRGGIIDVFTTADGLYDNYLSSVTEDRAGNLWMSANRGVFRVARRELERYAASRAGHVHSVAYGRADGMASSEANGGFQSGVARTSDGRLWYPTLVGIATVNPARITNAIPPAVAIERVVADGRVQDSTEGLALGPDLSVLEIDYSGLSLNAPSAVTFRYKLEGWDRDWIDAGTRRSATYSRLAPGHYRFRLMAANRDGVWGVESRPVTFTVRPHVWQTWWFRVAAALLAIAGIVLAVRARLRQVRAATAAAEREAAQRRITTILESITDGFFALDAQARFTYVNRTAERLLGRSAGALLGNSFWDCFPGARGTITERELRRVLGERTPVTFEAPDAPSTGTWLEVHAYPADDGAAVYFSDVTGRKRDEDALRNQKEEIEAQAEELAQQTEELARQNEILEENVRLKDEVERIARHDLRTPLNTIISLAQIVRDEAHLDGEHAASLQLIEQAGYRVLGMASLTLDLFKMEQGTYELVPRAVDVAAVAGRVIGDLAAQMRTREVTCEIAAQGEELLARGDELLVHAMLSNLLKNAIEASPTRGRVVVAIERGDRILVRIHNHGVIPEAIRSRLFEKYVTSGKKGGTGLGTYSARLMARTQGGDVRVEDSAVGRGTTIAVELPVASGDTIRAASVPGAAAHTPVSSDEVRPPRSVLIVDDDASNRAILRRFLAHPSWRIDEAENGPLAISMAAERSYDAIFMDIEMPVMDGVEAAGRIRANGGGSRIIAFSSHDDAPTRERALRGGCDAYVTKPASRQTVIEIVLGGAVPAAVAQLDPAIADLLPSFLERKRGEIEELRAALGRGESDAVRRLSHRLRGSFALYGMTEPAEICRELEERSRDGEAVITDAAERLDALYDCLRRIDAGGTRPDPREA